MEVNFQILKYLSKISSYVKAAYALCFIPWAGYTLYIYRMYVGFVEIMRAENVYLTWTNIEESLSKLKDIRSEHEDLCAAKDHHALSFTESEKERLKAIWKGPKIKRGLKNVPLHEDVLENRPTDTLMQSKLAEGYRQKGI